MIDEEEKVKNNKFEMKCPRCKKNEWKLGYEGESEKGYCDRTETVGTYIGIDGDVIITCLNCGFVHKINVGSD